MTKRRNRVNATGRSKTSRFARLDHTLLKSNAYRSLPPNARSLLVELTMLDNGTNNGSLYLSVRDGAHRMGVADLSSASRAFDDLIAMGFIEMTQDAHFRVKAAEASRARCWRLTWLAGPGRKGPTMDFLEREPAAKTLARKRMERGQKALKAFRQARDSGRLPVLDCDMPPPVRGEMPAAAVSDSDTSNCRNSSFPPFSRVRDSDAHIAVPMGKGATEYPLGWWQPDWTPTLTRLVFAASLADAGTSNPIVGRAAA